LQSSRAELERAINEADGLDLIDPEALGAALNGYAGVRGARKLREALDVRTFAATDSELERRFLLVARRAGLPLPHTGAWVNGFRVDFYWPELGLVVETDGLRYHRTLARQTRERRRDQAHIVAGLTSLRFMRAQVACEPGQVEEILRAVAHRAWVPSSR
jgi:very-short-patch-repair endonuclease